MKGQARQLGILFLLAVLIGLAIFFQRTLNPLRADLQVTQELHAQEQAAAEQRIEEGQRAEARYDDLRLRIEQDEAQYRAILERLPTRRDSGRLVDAIDQAANDTGMRIREVSPGSEENPLNDDVAFTTLSVIARGPYDAAYDFLARLEALPRSTRLSRLQLRRDNTTTWNDPDLILEAQLEVYLYRGGTP